VCLNKLLRESCECVCCRVPYNIRGYLEPWREEGDIRVSSAHCCQCAGVCCLLNTYDREANLGLSVLREWKPSNLGCDVVFLVPNNTLFHVECRRWVGSSGIVLLSYETTRCHSQQTNMATKRRWQSAGVGCRVGGKYSPNYTASRPSKTWISCSTADSTSDHARRNKFLGKPVQITHLFPCSVEVRNEWSYASTRTYSSIAL